MIDKEIYKKILYFNSKNTFTKDEIVEEIGIKNLRLLYNYRYEDAKINEFLSSCEIKDISFLTPDLETKIKKILELENITEEDVYNTFTFDEKIYLLKKDDYLFNQVLFKCDKIRFLTEEEAMEILKYAHDMYSLDAIIINSIDDDRKLIPFIKNIPEQQIYELLAFRNKPFSPEVLELIISLIPKDERYEQAMIEGILKSLSNEQKIEYINTLKDKYLVFIIIRSLPTPLKLKYLNKASRSYRNDLICSIEEDEIKRKLITITTLSKEAIIASIKSDEIKEELLNKYKVFLRGWDVGFVISSFKDSKYIEKYFHLLKSEDAKVGFINHAPENQEQNMLALFKTLKRKKSIEECISTIRKKDNFIDYINKIKDQEILKELINPYPNEANLYMFQQLSEKNREKKIKEMAETGGKIFPFYQYIENDAIIYESLRHNRNFPDYNSSFDIIITRIANYKHFDADKLIQICRILGLEVLTLLDNINITNLLNSTNEDFSKLLSFFDEEILSFDENNLNDALNALIQRKFRIKHPDDILIFTETRHAVADGNIDKVIELVEKVAKVVSLERFNITKEELVKGLMADNKEITELYNKITNEYLRILRTNYDIEEKSKAEVEYKDKSYDKNALIKYIIKNIPIDKIIQTITDKTSSEYLDLFTTEEKEIIKNMQLIKDVIEFKKNAQGINNISSEIKKNIKIVEEIIRKVYNDEVFVGVRKNSSVKKNDKNELLQVLCELDINQIKETIFKDEEIYQELLEMLKKRKLISWLGRFVDLPIDADIVLVPSVIASLIKNFNGISKHIFKEEATKTKEILTEYINNYNAVDMEELLLKGLNDSKLQKTDIIIMIKEISNGTKIPIDKLIRKLLESADMLRTDNLESAINILNPEIKSIYTKEKIKQILEKINEFRLRLSFEKIIKGSQIYPTDKELNNILNIVEQIHNIIPELQKSYILENLFDSAILFQTLDFEEALLKIDEKIKNKLSSDDITKVLNTICTFVKNLKKGNLVSSTSILDLAECYDSSSKALRILFDKENYDFLKRNPPPYPGNLTSKERINIALKLIKEMHERKYITVPPSRDIYTLPNNKKIMISVGDLHSLDNLTYGERTKACMRIGGAGDSLFNFCLKNENGFHVKFTDPENDKLVSRVSGFRNGNTVFLNELRDSLSKKYSNEHLIVACKLLAERLIEDSKDSKYPIENVVISPYYAMSTYFKKVTNLGDINIKKGFDNFYTDVNNYAIVLATSSTTDKFVPVKTNPDAVVKYESLRREIKRTNGSEAYRLKYQILLLEEHYSGNNFENIEIPEENDIIYAIQGEDWYITINQFGQIDSYIMKNSNNREKAVEEMSKELESLKSIIAEKGLDVFKVRGNIGGI